MPVRDAVPRPGDARRARRRRWRRRGAKILGGLLLLAAAFWLIAPYNIAASLPHAPGVSWLLHGYLKNAVRTWSLGAEPPPGWEIDDPALAALGAGHFETGCAPCHGAPGRLRNPRVLAMRPSPTELTGPTAEYADRELWWIARNGFKYTGMPAWTTQRRPDEPWAMAAFLRLYPTLDAAAYRALAYGPVEPEDPPAESLAVAFGGLNARLDDLMDDCARCHGRDGLGRDGVAPKLAGQSAAFIEATLEAYALGLRPSGFMEPVAAALSAEDRARLAARYAAMPSFAPSEPAPLSPLAEAGARLAAEGEPRDDVPSCLGCHGAERRAVYPRLAGQDRRWLERWLRLWREEVFGGTEYARLMHVAAQTLEDAEIEALAAYFAEAPAFGAERRDAAR